MKWIKARPIGCGSTATVSVATAIPSGELIAVKSVGKSHLSLIQKEKYILSQSNCPRIVKYLGYNVTSDVNKEVMYNLCMEFVAGGTLSDEVRRWGGRLMEEGVIGVYVRQILQGLEYLHENGVVHCDIKSQNILIGEDQGVKIADLGCAKLVGNNGGFATSAISGTPAFMAPEVARGEEQGFAADIWALGCTVLEMATGNSPWPELKDPASALYKIGFSGESPAIPGWFSEKAKSFLGKCLERDVKQRWTARELLEHPFLQGIDSNLLKKPSFPMGSPSSVLEQGTWGPTISPRDSIHELCVPNSSLERIKKLIGGSSSAAMDWSGENWVTVRGNGGEESYNSSIMNADDESGHGCSYLEDLGTLISDEGLGLGHSSDFSRTSVNIEDDIVLQNFNHDQSNHHVPIIFSIVPLVYLSFFLVFFNLSLTYLRRQECSTTPTKTPKSTTPLLQVFSEKSLHRQLLAQFSTKFYHMMILLKG